MKHYLSDIDGVLKEVGSAHQGLTEEEAAVRLRENGENKLKEAGKTSTFMKFLKQLADPMILILIAAAVVSGVMAIIENESFADVIIIVFVVLLNAVLGVIQENKAEKAIEALQEMTAATSKVIRNGKKEIIKSKDLVVGDIIVLEAGDSVPADARIIECASMKVEEAALTGESVPSLKQVERLELKGQKDVPLGDRKNMVYMGSTVVYGRGVAVVTDTGMNTEMGKIAEALSQAKDEATPLQKKLGQLSKILSFAVIGICVFIFVFNLITSSGGGIDKHFLLDTFMVAVSLAVAAIPEGLATVVTIVLSMGVTRMSKRNAVIRKLTAVETLGCAQVICSDKTGTLTQNRMTVRKLYTGGEVIDAKDADFRDPLQEPLLRTALLCSDAVISGDTEIGDPTETALVRLGETNGFDEDLVRNRWPRLTEIPFDSDRKMMSTVHKLAGGLMLVTKGATDVLLDRCVVTPEERARIEQVNEQFSNEGLRVLAFACRSVDSTAITLADENGLTFLGLIAMMDPPREESKAAVAECIRAGIRPIMITGDHKITAAAIAREIGILRDGTEAVEGAVIDGMSDEELQEFVPKVSVYARVSPEHKIRIVRAWQQRGNLVAMTGDGVNDAPALKQADIGVAMGITGTEVAKDAAGMVLTDDDFATIVKAVKNGRNVYANIKRAIQFLLSGNTAGILTVLYASLMGLPVPFAAVHLLFINLLTDSLPAIALGLEPHTDEVMSEKPRPRNEGILTKPFLFSVGIEGLVIAAATVTAFYLGLNAGGAAAGQTMAFSTLCLSRLFHGFSCKSQHPVLLTRHFWNNRALLGAFTIGALLLGLVLLVPALEPLFAVAPLSIGMVGAIVGLAFGSMLVIQLLKWIRR